jgi:hypothetical protein
VDNLTTKEDLTFADVKKRLIDMSPTIQGTSETALNTVQQKGNKKNKKTKKTDNKSEAKDCTWCAKHNPGMSLGHTWNDCDRLKKHNEEKKKESKDAPKQGEAHVTTEKQQVRTTSFYFDTACTSHMTPFPQRLQNYTICSGFVESSSKQQMEIKGKGDIVMDCALKDGSISAFRIHDVLFVPSLGKALISWRKLRNQYKKIGEGHYITDMRRDIIMFEAKFDGQLFKVPEVKQSAYATYEFWHQALQHTYLDPKLYDTKLPAKPDNYRCDSYIKAKLTKLPRHTTVNKNRKKFDLIHSDLSGPFSVPSYGGSLYYITLIDDAT